MKNLVILGAGTSGTMMANHLIHKLPEDWKISVIDQYKTHYYQPGFLFLPFDIYSEKDVKKKGKKYLPKGVTYIQQKIEKIVPEQNKVILENESLTFDILIVATGSKIAPEETEGMKDSNWHKTIFDFYTYEGALALRNKLRDWQGGKLVVHFTEMPIKCPVAPLEFAFLADSYFINKGMRDQVDITYVTPLGGAFTKPKATETLSYLLKDKNINVVTDFNIEKIDNEKSQLVDYGDDVVDFDLLVTVPTNMGDEMIERSGMGDDLNFVPTHEATLQSKNFENIFVIGDATDVPASKAGSVAHFEADILAENILLFINQQPLKAAFDGHANCFVETGKGKALLIDFNYTTEPVDGTFPLPGVGPFKLLKETKMNHLGKLAFKWIYWNMLLKGTSIPFVSTAMSEKGKNLKLVTSK